MGTVLIRDVELLVPEFKEKVKLLLSNLEEKNIKYFINETIRSEVVQDAYFSQGRFPLEETNKKRLLAGLWKITEKENSYAITWTKKSLHIVGKAIDIYPAMENGLPWFNAPDNLFERIARVAKELSLECGYYWQKPDMPHIQSK